MGSGEIKKDLQEFQAAVKKLSDKVGSAAALWRDSRFAELSASVGTVAVESKDLMVAGDRYCTAIDRFDKIAAEQY